VRKIWQRGSLVKAFLFFLLTFPALAQDLRVLTFNIRYDNPKDGPDAWPNRKEAVAKVIKEKADLAGLQEVKPEQRAWLIENLPEFGFIGIGRELKDGGESVPVLYRKDRFDVVASGTFWLSEKPDEPASTSWGNKLPRICTWVRMRDSKAGGVLWFYNVHLDHQSEPARVKGLDLVANRIGEREASEPVILVGDLNTSVGGSAVKALAERTRPAMISTYEALGLPAAGTFHGFKGEAPGTAIDFIFLKKGQGKVKSCEVLKTTYPGTDGTERYVSDHFPVTAVVSLKE
jgi:endonuclease/exonuclease/phosphatase family metal-dependent hydrolase